MKINTVLSTAVAAFVITGGSVIANAQTSATPVPASPAASTGTVTGAPVAVPHDRRLRELLKDLHLTKAQKLQIRPIEDEEKTKVAAIRADSSLSKDEKADKLHRLHQDIRAEIKPILTEAQWDQLVKLDDEERAATKM